MPDAATLSTVDLRRIGCVGAAETFMNSLTLKGGVLRNVGDMLRITGALELAANVNNKTSKLYFGATVIATRGPSADNASAHYFEALLMLLAGGTQLAYGRTTNRSTASFNLQTVDAIAENVNNPITIRTSGQGAATDDLISRFLKIEYLPVGSNYDF